MPLERIKPPDEASLGQRSRRPAYWLVEDEEESKDPTTAPKPQDLKQSSKDRLNASLPLANLGNMLQNIGEQDDLHKLTQKCVTAQQELSKADLNQHTAPPKYARHLEHIAKARPSFKFKDPTETTKVDLTDFRSHPPESHYQNNLLQEAIKLLDKVQGLRNSQDSKGHELIELGLKLKKLGKKLVAADRQDS